MKLKKKDFGKWDKEELSIIIKGYTAKQIAVDDTKFVACECNQPDADLQYDEWKLEH